MRKLKHLLWLGAFGISISGFSQHVLKGKVVHAATQEPLPFVNIAIKGTQKGTTSDVQGRFTIPWDGSGTIIQFSFVGFEVYEYHATASVPTVLIKMKERATELQAIEIRPGDNPALRIIRKAIENKHINDPENLPSFRFNAYNKLYMTFGGTEDSVASPLQDSLSNIVKDTVLTRPGKKSTPQSRYRALKKFADRNHLFVTESYTEKLVRKPNYSKEIVLANKMTGVKDPFFAFLATDFQPFSFYKDFIKLFDKEYINPISKGSMDRYDFTLVDTVYRNMDSVFIITFEPLPGKQFDALKGQLYISNDGYALEHVIAQPADDKVLIESRIQQRYEKVQGHWFPVQLNTELRLKEYKIGALKLMYISRSYLTNIQIGADIPKKEFGLLNVEFDPNANRQEDTYWNSHRTDSLGSKEKNTYHFYDSLGPKLKGLNRTMKVVEGLFLGHFKAGAFYVPLEHLVRFNKYEGVRLGLGIRTGEQISRFFTLEGYGGYGFNDKAAKYGGSLQLNLVRRKEAFLKFSYQQDIGEPGAVNFMKTAASPLNNQALRNWMTSRMDSVQQYKVELGFRPLRFTQLTAFLRQQIRNPAYTYSHVTTKDPAGLKRNFTATEAGLQLRYAFNETYTQIGSGKVVTNFAYPQLNLFVSQGIAGLGDGTYDFKKIQVQIDHRWMTRGFGKTVIQLDGGQIVGEVPYPYLFNGKGSLGDDTNVLNSFVINNYFQTMGLYEFASDKYGYIFLSHNFGRIAGAKSRYFRPELAVVQNIGYGSLANAASHQGITFKTMEKGFFESGLTLSNVLRFKYVRMFYYGIGIGAFYRYGSYALPKTSDNMALKIIITAQL